MKDPSLKTLLFQSRKDGIMENYIGVKIVKAEPQEKDGVPGYG